MTYRITGLDPEPFQSLLLLDQDELASRRAARVVADQPNGYPCRVSLVDAEEGETLLLVNHVSNDFDSPYRSAFAIFVREAAKEAACFVDQVPFLLDRRTIGLRAYDEEGRLKEAKLAMPGEADRRIRELLDRPDVATVHAHNAAHGCFLASVWRD